jgi:RNA polymerase sigma factor (TIGR02999 family)
MASQGRDRVSEIVAGWTGGERVGRDAIDELAPPLYQELRRLARWHMDRGTPGVTLQPTALVHEAYIRLVDRSQQSWRGRTHFVAVASRVMRNLLIDLARARAADKRGGGWRPITLTDEIVGGHELRPEDMLALDQALERLAAHDERQVRVVELRFFGGLKVAEVAEVLGVSQRTAEGLWTHARAWLLRELSRSGAADVSR